MQSNKSAQPERLFTAKVAFRELSQPTGTPAVLYNDLIQLALGNNIQHSEQIMRALNSQLPLRRQYQQIVKSLSFSESPAQAAASTTNALSTRQTDLFTIKFKRDKQQASQIFVILHIPHPTTNQIQQGVVLNVISDQKTQQINFPALIEGTSQYLFDEQDPRLQLLLDIQSHISIMP
ncbi:hypothetical protein [uncultured Paraglaciecola sp.]|uniref:hypothetical protein n=1 Tax=uncultured Paraglaciecola sp. TaxID=1765024 RepID=UPI0026273DB3|nr:hypothetical protein [uncultured Paraglaciecola sp.]